MRYLVRHRILFFLPAALVAVLIGHALADGALSGSPVGRELNLTYSGRIQLPANIREADVWIPLAGSREGQRLVKRKINLPVDYQIFHEPVYGNEMIYLRVEKAGSTIPFSVEYHAVINPENSRTALDSKETALYLKPSRLMSVNDRVREIARSATSQKMSLMEKGRAIYDYVIAHMQYDKNTPGWGKGDTERACEVGRGNCTDFHSLFISVAHAAEIPSRFKIGFQIPAEPAGAIHGYHCWAEFSDEKNMWRPIDASEAWKHPEKREDYFARFDANKFLISIGRDIELVPRQKGEPVNIFFYPYVEADGKAIEDAAKMSFSYENLK